VRIHFCSLVKEEYFRKQRDEISDFGTYYDDAMLTSNGNSSIEQVIEEAHRLKTEKDEE
jgi:hypothetical protein